MDTKQFEIIEYTPDYAEGVADMWNRSTEGWLGESFNYTGASVRAQEAASSAFNVFLAVAGCEVIGYCNLMEHGEDRDTLYIAMLNCRPDWHGKKVGKALVKRAVERTIELGWGRLDLYTWPGNLKAVPLYKKCGFFFEDREDTTHLMNMIPDAIKQEMTMDFFEEADWYDDSVRPIDFDPDGRKENGFELYDYSWKKNNRYLNMTYSRYGRGLFALETEKFSIKLTAPAFKQPFGATYEAVFTFENKTARPIHVEINGKSGEAIQFDFNWKGTVKDRLDVPASYFIGPLDKPQDEQRTHPVIRATVSVDGKSADFRLGIRPVFPLDVILGGDPRMFHPGEMTTLWLTTTNGFDREQAFTVELHETEEVIPRTKRHRFVLPAEERKSIPIEVEIRTGTYWSPEIRVTVENQDGQKTSFTRRPGVLLPAPGSMYYGVSDTQAVMGCDHRFVTFSLCGDCNETYLRDVNCRYPVFITPPKLGKPFSREFENKPAASCTFRVLDDSIEMRADFISDRYPEIGLTVFYRLYRNGVLERWNELTNNGAIALSESLFIRDAFHMPRDNYVYDNGNEVIEALDDVHVDGNILNTSAVTGQWLFGRNADVTVAAWWDFDMKPEPDEWLILFGHEAGKMKPGEVYITRPVHFTINQFDDWYSFVRYAFPQKAEQYRIVRDCCCLVIAGGNPVIEGPTTAALIDERMSRLFGVYRVQSLKDSVHPVELEITERVHRQEVTLQPYTPQPLDILEMTAECKRERFSRQTIVFGSFGKIHPTLEQRDGYGILRLENGVLGFEAAPAYLPGLISLRHKGTEWLNTSYPTPRAFSWWNPWFGGMSYRPEKLRVRSIRKENILAHFVEVPDRFGKSWQGFRIDVNIHNNKDWKGLSWQQYYLTRPGIAAMVSFARIRQEEGRHLPELRFTQLCFINPGDNPGDVSVQYRNRLGEIRQYQWGDEYWVINGERSFRYLRNDSGDALQVFWNKRAHRSEVVGDSVGLEAWQNSRLPIRPGRWEWIEPGWFLFTRDYLPERSLNDLAGIFDPDLTDHVLS